MITQIIKRIVLTFDHIPSQSISMSKKEVFLYICVWILSCVICHESGIKRATATCEMSVATRQYAAQITVNKQLKEMK